MHHLPIVCNRVRRSDGEIQNCRRFAAVVGQCGALDDSLARQVSRRMSWRVIATTRSWRLTGRCEAAALSLRSQRSNGSPAGPSVAWDSRITRQSRDVLLRHPLPLHRVAVARATAAASRLRIQQARRHAVGDLLERWRTAASGAATAETARPRRVHRDLECVPAADGTQPRKQRSAAT
jgi:hypothetical protein